MRALHLIVILPLVIFLAQCGGGTKLVRKVEPGPSSQKSDAPAKSASLPESVQVRTFDQIYKTMASLTNVHPSELSASSTSQAPKRIYDEYLAIKSQLPNERNAQSFSSFNQIAATRLGFFFCNNYLDKNPDLIKLSQQDFINHLIEKFVGESPAEFKDYKFVSESLNILLDPEKAKSYMPAVNASSTTKRYKAGCTALLSSAYVLVIRSIL